MKIIVKKGIGKLLLETARNYAKSQNAVRLTLSTAKTNKTAQIYMKLQDMC